MSEFKYVVVDLEQVNGQIVREAPFIFPKEVNHDIFVNILRYLHRGQEEINIGQCVSAGFLTCHSAVHCYGRSETLDIESRGAEDENLILMYQYGVSIK